MNDYIFLSIIIIITGIIAGSLSSLLGIGGGLLYTPLILFVGQYIQQHIPPLLVTSTSLFCIFYTVLSARIGQLKIENVQKKDLYYCILGGGLGIIIAYILIQLNYFSELFFLIGFSGFICFAIILQFFKLKPRQNPSTLSTQTFIENMGIAFLGGSANLLAGIGGGILMTPLWNSKQRFTLQKSVALSLQTTIITSSIGCLLSLFESQTHGISPFTIGSIDIGLGFLISIGAIIGSQIGNKISQYISSKEKRYILLALLITILIKLWI